MNALPRLWVQINKFAKDLENKAQKRAEARKKRTTTDEFFNDAFGWERKIEEEIEILFRHAKNNDPRQMKLPFGDENQGSSSGNNNEGTNGDGEEPQDNSKRDVITREKRWQELAVTGKLSKEVRETIKRTKGKGVYKQHGLELAHKPGKPAKNGHDFREALPKTKSDHRNQHRFYKDNDNDTISIRRDPLPNNKMTGPQPGIFKKLGEIEKEIKGANT